MKETAVVNASKEAQALYKNDTDFEEYIRKHLSAELAERIMNILKYESEIVIKQSDMDVEEFMPTNSVRYKQIIEWDRLVRCKDCKNSAPWYADRRRCFLWSESGVSVFDNGFCNYGERKDDDHHEG